MEMQHEMKHAKERLDEAHRRICQIRRDLRMLTWGVAGTMLAIVLLFAIVTVHLSN